MTRAPSYHKKKRQVGATVLWTVGIMLTLRSLLIWALTVWLYSFAQLNATTKLKRIHQARFSSCALKLCCFIHVATLHSQLRSDPIPESTQVDWITFSSSNFYSFLSQILIPLYTQSVTPVGPWVWRAFFPWISSAQSVPRQP